MTTDTTAATAQDTDWAAREKAAFEVLDRARVYLKTKADGTYVPPPSLISEAQGGTRGSYQVAQNLREYLRTIDEAQERMLREAAVAAKTTEQELTTEQKALALEKAVTRLIQKAIRLLKRDRLCQYGTREFAISIGVPLPEVTIASRFRITFDIAVETPLEWADWERGDMHGFSTAPDRKQATVVQEKLERSLRRAISGSPTVVVAAPKPAFVSAGPKPYE